MSHEVTNLAPEDSRRLSFVETQLRALQLFVTNGGESAAQEAFAQALKAAESAIAAERQAQLESWQSQPAPVAPVVDASPANVRAEVAAGVQEALRLLGIKPPVQDAPAAVDADKVSDAPAPTDTGPGWNWQPPNRAGN